MKQINFDGIIKSFSDKEVDSINTAKDYTSYMVNKTGTYYFIRVHHPKEDKLPYISIYHYVSELPNSLNTNENLLSKVCNTTNAITDNGTSTHYVSDKEESFIVIKAGILYVNDALSSSQNQRDSEFTITMFLYSAMIAINETRVKLFNIITHGGIEE